MDYNQLIDIILIYPITLTIYFILILIYTLLLLIEFNGHTR